MEEKRVDEGGRWKILGLKRVEEGEGGRCWGWGGWRRGRVEDAGAGEGGGGGGGKMLGLGRVGEEED